MIDTTGIRIGDALRLDEQRFVAAEEKPYRRADGTSTNLIVWETNCPKCEEAFEVMTPRSATTSFVRRCPACRKARRNKPVKGKRGRKIIVTLEN